ncbi:MAG: molybdopterin-containing oxidoreductase family protein [Vicinamibacterales bacterium]
MDRRDFIKLTAISGTSATLASCGNPEHQLIRFVPDEDIVPGVAEWKPSVCPMCAAGCGVNVRVMDADVDTTRNGQAGVVAMTVAKKLEGNRKDPISQGGLCARGQASIQITYHPDRLTHPMKRTGARGAGEFQQIGWDQAIAELTGQLDALAAAGDQKSLAYLARPHRGRRTALAAEFLKGFGTAAPLSCELFADDVARRANAISFGHAQLPTIDLARTRFAISFGADFLGTWNSPVSQSAAYGVMRQGRPGVRGAFVQVESRMSLTGASADEWVPVKPGTEGVLALGLAHVMLAGKRPADAGRAGAAIDGWSAGLPDYTPARVEQITGLPARRVERIAHALVELQPAVAFIGGAPLAHTNGLFHALAVNALNGLLGNVGQPGGIFFTPGTFNRQSEIRNLQPQDLSSAKLLLLDDVNPVFAAPKAWRLREALAGIPFIASFGSFLDDTSIMADLLLPDHSFLESWVDATPESGSIEAVTTVAGPVMKPLHATRATADVLIEIAGKLKSPVPLPWKSAEEVAKQTPAQAPQSAISNQHSAIKYAEPTFDGDAATYPFHFLPYASLQFGDGSSAHLPWLQEMPDPLTSAMWSSWVEINPQTAERLRLGQGDVIDVTSARGTVRAAVMIFPGIAPDIVAMPVGQGHETFTRYASGRGVNPVAILAPATVADTGALAWAATRVKIVRVGDPDRSLIMFAGELREHPHEGETR